jgi:hypothetical protein
MAADGVSQRAIACRLGINRRTVRRMLNSDEPPRYECAATGSMLDPLEPVLRQLLAEWPQIKAPVKVEQLRANLLADGRLRCATLVSRLAYWGCVRAKPSR